MTFSPRKPIFLLGFLFIFIATISGQELRRELGVITGSTLQVVNKIGRVSVRTAESGFTLTASSAKGVSDSEVKINGSSITVLSKDPTKRIDISLVVPERSTLKIETGEGAIEAVGNLSLVQAKSDTGTIMVDVPTTDLKYRLEWTESRPRFLADFELEKIKEQSAGRFQIKGSYREEIKVATPKPILGNGDEQPKPPDPPKIEPVAIELTTARGIVLINVPPGEVNSDLRERPLTNAAKAIVRSGDSLLMEAIRRASPKYFGDYARTLPPIRTEPTFATRAPRTAGPNADLKTALVRVTDLKNRAIDGLSRNDFEITENGTVREIVSIEKSEAPFNLVLLLDVSGSVENYVNFIRKAARNFVDTVGKQDKVAIVIFNEDVKQLSTFTTDKGKLSESLDTFDAGGGTAYYDALAFTIADTLRPLKGERTAIVVLTDGDDNRSFLAFDSLAGSIQESGALIYPLYVPSGLIALAAQNINADIDPLRKKYMSLTAKSEGEGEKLAQLSGGVYYPITQIGQIQKAYEDIVLQMRAAYNVTFRSSPEPGGSGASPKLKIRVKKENAFPTITAVTAN